MPSEVESTGLAPQLAEAQDPLEDIRLSLDARYPTESEEEPEPDASLPGGIRIALAAFVPTFLVVFLGLPYLIGPPLVPLATPIVTPPTATMLPVSLTSTGDLSGSSFGPMGRWTTRLDPVEAGPRQPSAPAFVSRPEPSAQPKPAPVAPRPVSWERAAAFADERSALQIATTLRRRGHRVDLRQERSAPLPWVVWVGQSPSSPRSLK